MQLMIIENRPNEATFFDSVGVDRIFIDLETLNKVERQGHLNTVISDHSLEDIGRVKPAVKNAKVLVRINPLNPNSSVEINEAIKQGADILMLPMFKTADEVGRFLEIVSGRVKTNLLLETPEAVGVLSQIVRIPGINEIHVGLNDLSIALKKKFMMSFYATEYLVQICEKVREHGISLGIGGIATMEGGAIPGKYIVARGIQLGSERFILSRSFPRNDHSQFAREVILIRDWYESVKSWGEEDFKKNEIKLSSLISQVESTLQT